MPDLINTLLSEQFWSFWILLLIILLERYLPWPDKYHPISFINALATGMQTKVLSPQRQSIGQQKISGSLAFIVLLLPFCAILAVLKYFSQYPMFFEAIMLLVALRFENIANQTRKVSLALLTQKKMLARHALSQIVLRETDKMSPLGMVKASIETLLLRYCYQYCSVIFWYLLTGGIGALLYRLVYELSLCWNTKLARFEYFGLPIRRLSDILQWLPSKLASISLVLAVNIRQGSIALFQRLSYQNNHVFILNVNGASLGIELAGPAYYTQQKIWSTKCGGNRQVILADNLRTLTAINRATWVWLTIYFMFCALCVVVSK